MDRSTVIFGIILLLLAPVLWPVAKIIPDRHAREARQLQRETECRKLIIFYACAQGDLPLARELVYYWKNIVPNSAAPREAIVILRSTLSRERKLEAIKSIAARAGGFPI